MLSKKTRKRFSVEPVGHVVLVTRPGGDLEYVNCRDFVVVIYNLSLLPCKKYFYEEPKL